MNGQPNGASGTSSPLRIYDVRSVTFPVPTGQSEDYESLRGIETAIVIDNGMIPRLLDPCLPITGSSQLRAGWASETSPRLAIENLVARYKERKSPKTFCLVGNDVLADQASRAAAKSPYEGPIISNWDLMVQANIQSHANLGRKPYLTTRL